MDRHIDYYIINSNIREAVAIKEISNNNTKLSLENLHVCINAKENAETKLDICKQRYNHLKL
jgi:hypothetical protein